MKRSYSVPWPPLVDRSDCGHLAIEDSPAGISAARDAGMFVLGVTNTHAPAELRGAHAIIASLMRLDVSANPLQDVRRVRVRWKDGIEDLQDPV